MVRSFARAVLLVSVLALLITGCVPLEERNADIVGRWVCDNPTSAPCSLVVDEDGTFTVVGLPRSAMGGRGRSIDWSNLVDTDGSWSASDNSQHGGPTFYFTFVVPNSDLTASNTVVLVDGELTFLVSAAEEVYVRFSPA